jgi:hypothetical protein
MEMEKIILSEVSQAQKAKKAYVLPHMWIIDPKQMQKYYWTWVTHEGESKYRKNRER